MWYYYKEVLDYVRSRLEYVSEINKDVAQVFFAALAIETLTKSPVNWKLVILGMFGSSLFWLAGIMSFSIKK